MVVIFDKGLEIVFFEIRRCLEMSVDAPPPEPGKVARCGLLRMSGATH